MSNYFITQPPFGKLKGKSSLIAFANKVLRFMKTGYTVSPVDTIVDMNTLEQRINYYHLLEHVLDADIPGDVIELGTFTGQCAMLFQKVLEQHQSVKTLHLYDTFESKYTIKGSVEEQLIQNFKNAGLSLPVLHKGLFEDTIPGQLPAQISFVHIDCGFGGDRYQHKSVITHCLEAVYPKMPKGSVCILMDYYDEAVNGVGFDAHPGVKMACDEFLKDKPETVSCLYGNQYYHGFFRKK
ncbi:TylF/MycF/NovP-related O-methyltransferase [Mucilaginibacter phyllosphaerae]|uniref:O-methyltransferase n=1 Tax=Mucilaginibacter phyllosphaerae TaxID=1812349 RepID=A0A4Y8AFL6_9SPHI|nr:TylF/MycF/NovP-related O-methyltransferase [Mucilaginibacter phyllosphaerae]MBB3971244.1 O-methyltransferase [Mucilaginibacter phyllosphaerae]TEW66855.1 hypothetical protein E2R65_10605 [Mucilaginibacter phyllosphaerae]GGH12365.1 hypothetical protein GCM10007352_19110 [Mucilaginibacter phyllosphaerae]